MREQDAKRLEEVAVRFWRQEKNHAALHRLRWLRLRDFAHDLALALALGGAIVLALLWAAGALPAL